MIIVGKKRTAAAIFSALIFMSLSLGAINLAVHPNMRQWIDNKQIITEVSTSERVIALTFDDGPDPINTPEILRHLKKYGAKATFFILGKKAERYPQIVQQIVKDGHEIGNHSYSHADFNNKSKDFIINEIRLTNDIIFRLTGQKCTLFRPPGGYLSDSLVNEIVPQENMQIAYWSYIQDSKDWVNGKSAKKIANYILKHIAPGQIIILHDGSSNGINTAKAVDYLLEELTKLDYQVVSVSELIKLENQ